MVVRDQGASREDPILNNFDYNLDHQPMDSMQSEMRLLQFGPGISVTYFIFSTAESLENLEVEKIGEIGDVLVSATSLYIKNSQNQWVAVTKDHTSHPNHGDITLLLSNTGPHWGHFCENSVSIAEAAAQHLDRIERGDIFKLDEDGLDDDLDEDLDSDGLDGEDEED